MRLARGDWALVSPLGAQLLAWQVDGRERVYLSPNAVFDGKTAIRGGLPLCFPQFNQRVIEGRCLPKHGFARTLRWETCDPAPLEANDEVELRLELSEANLTADLRAVWPFAFRAATSYRLTPGRLRCTFELTHRGQEALPFALALHTYLAVDDVSLVHIEGLEGRPYWDTLVDPEGLHRQQDAPELGLTIQGAIDRIYLASPSRLWLRGPGMDLVWTKSPSLTDTVVWNPGPSSQLADLPAGGFRHLLCVEAARLEPPMRLAPGQNWVGWQELALASVSSENRP